MSSDPAISASTHLAHTASPQATPERPWLGLAHFTAADRDYFYGRDAEIRELADRVRRAPLTVLYGVSGYGKSSLLGAGLIPVLAGEGHPVVLMRRCYDDLGTRPLPADVIAAAVAAIPGAHGPGPGQLVTLWEFFHDRRQPWFQASAGPGGEEALESAETRSWPVLIFDQFEEIFLKGEDRVSADQSGDERARAAARDFLTQLSDLVENRPPAGLRERIESGPLADRRALVRQFDFQARPVRVGVAVRDDFLARLERWRRAMPSLMEHRVELRLLSGPQALKAVFEPGTKRPGLPPIIPPDVAAAIVRAAANVHADLPLEEIDAVPPILSLLCERLNERRLAAAPPPASIGATDFSPGEADRILERFYHDKVGAHPRALREFLEDKLVSESGFRENVTVDAALASLRSGVPDIEARLRQLVDDRVLVIEDRGGIARTEFTHDRLAVVALQRRAEREARRRRLKALAWAVGGAAVALVSLGLTVWALIEQGRAKHSATIAAEQTSLAEDRAREAEREKKNAEEAKSEAQKQAAAARKSELEAVLVVHFMDSQVDEAFVDAVPLPLRERVSARLDALLTAHQSAFVAAVGEQEILSYYLRKTRVHFDAIQRYEGEKDFSDAAKKVYIGWERESAAATLQQALPLGETLAQKFPDDRGVTRDRILALYDYALLSRQLGDKEPAARHLREAQALLDGISKDGGFPKVLWMDWMGLPNLDAALGDALAEAGDQVGARASYEKALVLQSALAARPSSGKDRAVELKRLQELVKGAPAKPASAP